MVVKKSTGNIYIYYDFVHASVPSEKPYVVENLGWGWKEWEVLVNKFKAHNISIYKILFDCFDLKGP